MTDLPLDRPVERGLSLRTKTFFLAVGVSLAFSAVFISAVSYYFLGSLQRELTNHRIGKVLSQLELTASWQVEATKENACWDDPHAFLSGENPEFPDYFVGPEPFAGGQDFVVLLKRDKSLALALSSPSEEVFLQDLPKGIDWEIFKAGNFLGTGESSALASSPVGPLLISSCPVLKNDGEGPPMGWYVTGKFLDGEWLEKIETSCDVKVSISLDVPVGATGQTSPSQSVGPLGTCIVHSDAPSPFGNGDVAVRAGFPDALHPGREVAFHIVVPAKVYAPVRELRNWLAGMFLVESVVLAGCMLFVIESLFLGRILRMERSVQKLMGNLDSNDRLEVAGKDEIARLAHSTNQLLEVLRCGRDRSSMHSQLFSSVLDSASEGIIAFRSLWNTDNTIADFMIVLANRSAGHILSQPADQLIGRSLLESYPGMKAEGIFERFVRVVQTQKSESQEFFYGQDGLRLWLHLSATPWDDGFVLTFEEIGRRKQAERNFKLNMEEIERFNRAMIGREERILEMKSEVNTLRASIGLPPAYKTDSRSDGI